MSSTGEFSPARRIAEPCAWSASGAAGLRVSERSGVKLPRGGWTTTTGPEHFVRLATTSASMERSAKAILGCDLSCCHASFAGILEPLEVSWELLDASLSDTAGFISAFGAIVEVGAAGTVTERWSSGRLLLSELDSVSLPFSLCAAEEHLSGEGQVAQGDIEHAESPSAVQKAFPKSSSLQAAQLDGSPEHRASDGALGTRFVPGKAAIDVAPRRADGRPALGADVVGVWGEGEGSRIWKRALARSPVVLVFRRSGTAGW